MLLFQELFRSSSYSMYNCTLFCTSFSMYSTVQYGIQIQSRTPVIFFSTRQSHRVIFFLLSNRHVLPKRFQSFSTRHCCSHHHFSNASKFFLIAVFKCIIRFKAHIFRVMERESFWEFPIASHFL